ncbi:MAG TPA: helix-turn-helix transcriptional regulator [Steroidobacteraceae bacterium]|nr:helix-turn-helix transcriptional regulator [Steroidobacteraceae bacterium]
MAQAKLASLGNDVRKHRANKTLREAATSIGISPATLMRVETGRIPDVETYGKLCTWLGVDPGRYLGIQPASAKALPAIDATTPTHIVVSAHLRADRLPEAETVKALANMIMFAAKSQRQKSTLTDADT